jgi:hypothetical protein
MPTVDPSTKFYISIFVTVAIGVSSGSLVLTHAIPQDYIPFVTAWCGIISFAGSAFLTALNGMATTTANRIAAAAADPAVGAIVTTKEQAAAAASPKVTNGVPKP